MKLGSNLNQRRDKQVSLNTEITYLHISLFRNENTVARQVQTLNNRNWVTAMARTRACGKDRQQKQHIRHVAEARLFLWIQTKMSLCAKRNLTSSLFSKSYKYNIKFQYNVSHLIVVRKNTLYPQSLKNALPKLVQIYLQFKSSKKDNIVYIKPFYTFKIWFTSI